MSRSPLLLALPAMLVPAALSADELRPPSRIAAVEVLTAGAIVTRLAEIAARPDGTVVVFPDLPEGVDRQSIRVRGDGGFAIGAVDARLVPADPRPANAPDIEKRLQDLRDQRAAFDADLAAADSRKRLADALLKNPSLMTGSGDHAQPLTADALAVVAKFVEDSHRQATQTALDVAKRRAVIDAEIAALETKLQVDPSRRRPHTEVRVALAAIGDAAQNGKLSVEYRVTEAHWTPLYDARLATTTAPAKLELVRRAEIVQRTGEDWSGVTLSLSTARVAGRTAPPDLASLRVAFEEPLPPPPPRSVAIPAPAGIANQARRAPTGDALALDGTLRATEEPASTPAPEPEAALQTNGIEATFTVPGQVNVTGTGEPTTVRIETIDAAPILTAIAVPVVDQTAYLQARYRHASEAPLLAGRVALYRDGVFVGMGRVGFVARGDDLNLGFGADPRIKITRTPVARNESTSGILGNWRVETSEATISVRNLGTVPLSVRLIDRQPFAETAEITIEPVANATPATERDVDGKRGILAFTLEAAPGTERVIRTGWRITSPKDKRLVETASAAP